MINTMLNVLTHCHSRPEKDHRAQLHAFHQVLKTYPEYLSGGKLPIKLVLIGGSRNAEDAARVEGLRTLAKELKIEVCILSTFSLINI